MVKLYISHIISLRQSFVQILMKKLLAIGINEIRNGHESQASVPGPSTLTLHSWSSHGFCTQPRQEEHLNNRTKLIDYRSNGSGDMKLTGEC